VRRSWPKVSQQKKIGESLKEESLVLGGALKGENNHRPRRECGKGRDLAKPGKEGTLRRVCYPKKALVVAKNIAAKRWGKPTYRPVETGCKEIFGGGGGGSRRGKRIRRESGLLVFYVLEARDCPGGKWEKGTR